MPISANARYTVFMNRGLWGLLASALSLIAQSTPAPKSASGIELGAMDRSEQPCMDFYQFACGNWRKNNPVPADRSRWGRFDELSERNNEVLHQILENVKVADAKRSTADRQTGDFYASCMDEAGIVEKGSKPVQSLLDEIARTPNKAGITDHLITLHRRNITAFFSIDAEQDAKDATKMIAGLDQAGLSLPDRDYYLKTDAASVELRAKFVAHVHKMFELLGDSAQVAGAKAAVILRMETDLAKRSLDLVSRRDPNKIYHKYSIQELISLSPGIDWMKFFAGIGLPGLANLNVAVPPFVRQIESVLVQNSLDDLKTYLSWNVLSTAAPLLATPFEQEDWQFFSKTLSGAQQQRPRWKRCVSQTDTLLGDALGQKFVERTFGAEGKQRTLAMVREIETSMERDIQSLDWMSAETKKQALTKLHAITNKIGFPDKWKDYSSVQIARDDALGNFFRLREWQVGYELSKIGKPVDKTEWSMSPPTVNAYYNAQMNDINFPAGILQPPFYANAADAAVNYGAIGAVIGHELTHGFDDEGRQFDATGNLQDWWTAQDGKAFERRADCIAEQYGQYTSVEDVRLNGRLTLGENVADNGGVRLALMSLARVMGDKRETVDGYTLEQRFFIGYGQSWCENMRPELARMLANVDPHSPGRFRVNGVLSNSPEFQKAFSCKAGQLMMRKPACRIW